MDQGCDQRQVADHSTHDHIPLDKSADNRDCLMSKKNRNSETLENIDGRKYFTLKTI